MAQSRKSKLVSEADAKIVLDAFNERTFLNDQGQVSWNGFDLGSEDALLAEVVAFDDGVTARERQALVNRALIDCRKEGPVTLPKLRKKCHQKAALLSQGQPAPYTMWTRVKLEQFPHDRDVRLPVDGVSVSLTHRLPECYSLKRRFINGIGDVDPQQDARFPFAVIRMKAKTDQQAAEMAFDALDTVYALSNVQLADWNIFGGEHHAEAKLISYQYQFLFRRRQQCDPELQWFDPEFRKIEWDRQPLKFQKLATRLPLIRRGLKALAYHPLKPKLLQALKQIHDGMSSTNTTYRLLRFWSALETLFSEHERTSTDVIIDRALFGERDREAVRLKLRYLSDIRNKYVHAGREAVGIHYLTQFLRDFVSLHVRYLIYRGSDFASHADFLQMASLPHDLSALDAQEVAIGRRRRVIQFGKHD